MQGTSYILAHHFNIKLMSKTYEMYLNKAQTLIDGLKKNLNVVSDYGINQEDLRKLEQAVQEAGKLNEDVDRRRAELNLVVPQANKKLAEIKVAMNDISLVLTCHLSLCFVSCLDKGIALAGRRRCLGWTKALP